MNQLCARLSVRGAFLLAALCGLFSALPARAEEDARQATPPPGKALVFVIRIDREPIAAQVPVIVNTELVGELANGTFTTATVSPGWTYLRVGDRVLSTLSWAAEANQSYFVWVEAIHGLTLVRTEVRLVSETEGRRALAQSRFVGVATARVPPPVAQRPVVPPPVVPPPAVAPAVSAPFAPVREWNVALIAKAGTFKLSKENHVVAGVASTYDTVSKSVSGVEAEWRSKTGVAVGGEVFSYKNDLGPTGVPSNAGQEVLAFMVNGKYYFRAASWLYPFVGAGVGQTNVSYSGGVTGSATGLAYQGLAGMEFRFKSVGLNLQYKFLASTIGGAGREVDVGGSGILAGISVIF